ncbi:MAG TPA: DUF4249 domain-containing protein [Flavisolibacter sp.]
MKWILLFALFVFLTGCEKSIDFDLEESEPKLVVEATIENGVPPIVVLSSSLNYFSRLSPQILAESFVHDAVVRISNGDKTHQLKEYAVPLGSNIFIYYYSIDSADLSTAFTGELNKSYTLQVVSKGEEYRATTEIGAFNKRIDSVWFKPRPGDSSEVSVLVKATDPAGFGDYVRYWTKINRGPLLPGFASVYDDFIIDGTTYELEVEPGVDRNDIRDGEERAFKRGDTVTLKLSSIGKATYDFWRTMEYTYASVGNPFSSPIKVTSNISNNALGYFGGYASQYRTIIIPK